MPFRGFWKGESAEKAGDGDFEQRGQEPIVRSTLWGIWLLVPDPFFKAAKPLRSERYAGYLIPQFSGNADSAGIDTQLFAPFTHQQISPDCRRSHKAPCKISRFLDNLAQVRLSLRPR